MSGSPGHGRRRDGARRMLGALAVVALLFGGLAGAAPAAPRRAQCFDQTGFCIVGDFFAYWQAHGGLAINGYPISEELNERLEDGREYRVQYFERVRMERHPENRPPADVLLGQFGRLLHPADPPAPRIEGPEGSVRYFPETGHNVSAPFLAYWEGNGDLAQFGLPLTEVIREQLEDGNEYAVQYFERARFELHPGSESPIQLGQFGRRVLTTVSLAGAAWIDRQPLPNWNAGGASVPPAPAPFIAPPDVPPLNGCPGRASDGSAEEGAVAGAGWILYGPTGRAGDLAIVRGRATADGMCRPLQYQEFVFVGGRFAGTLSPASMDSRTDGALNMASIADGGGQLTATYRRYAPRDAACCPSRTSTVTFAVDRATPRVVPTGVTTVPTER